MPDPDLETAYDLKTPDDARKLYADWAETYDSGFSEEMGYDSPRQVARIYCEEGGDAPCLDVGAGTGLVAAHLEGLTVDGLDISPEMLAVAGRKGLYRKLIEADLNASLPMSDATYGGVISAGTFTHGHVGPDCLPELLRVVRPGGLFACTVVPEVFDGRGFGSALASLQAAGRITPLRFAEVRIYDGADHAHAEDRALVMIFRKR